MVHAAVKPISIPTLTHVDKNATNLRVVDPLTDPHVWAIVDEGCNSGCHGELWHKNALEKWKRMGYQSYLASSSVTSYKGVGMSKTSGKYRMPLGFRLQQSGMHIPGSGMSHEIPGSPHPMLLSQSMQALLGMVKDTRDGTITLKDYEHQNLEVARQARTGLFMVRIDH